jgi:hypothetical protein
MHRREIFGHQRATSHASRSLHGFSQRARDAPSLSRLRAAYFRHVVSFAQQGIIYPHEQLPLDNAIGISPMAINVIGAGRLHDSNRGIIMLLSGEICLSRAISAEN